MEISELNELESSVQSLLALAKVELEEKRLQQQREEQIQEAVSAIAQRIEPLLAQVEEMIQRFDSQEISDSAARQKLVDKADDLRQQLENAPFLAAQTVDRQLIAYEERLLDEQLLEQTNRWRQALKTDLLDMIAEQEDFFSATDASIALRGYVHDLKAISALEEAVDALIERINSLSEEGPVARLRGTHEQTLNFIYNKALENRARVDRATEVQPRTRHRASEKRPNPYSSLTGKVVVFGGHDRLANSIRNRLRDSHVDLVWCTAQDGLQMAQQAENHIYNADLLLIITGYASHSLTEKAVQVAQKANKTPEMINTTGMTRVLEAIEYGLKTRLLANQYSRSA
jgi:vacuolar-type H+-ATPase subunit I/STV1